MILIDSNVTMFFSAKIVTKLYLFVWNKKKVFLLLFCNIPHEKLEFYLNASEKVGFMSDDHLLKILYVYDGCSNSMTHHSSKEQRKNDVKINGLYGC